MKGKRFFGLSPSSLDSPSSRSSCAFCFFLGGKEHTNWILQHPNNINMSVQHSPHNTNNTSPIRQQGRQTRSGGVHTSMTENSRLAGVQLPRVINQRPGRRNEPPPPASSPVGSILSGIGTIGTGIGNAVRGILSPTATRTAPLPEGEEQEEAGEEEGLNVEFPGLVDDGDPDGALLTNAAVFSGNRGINSNIYMGMEGGRPSQEGSADHWRNRAMLLESRLLDLEDTVGSMSMGNQGHASASHQGPPLSPAHTHTHTAGSSLSRPQNFDAGRGGAPGYYVTQVQQDKQVKRFALENTTHMLNHGPPTHLNRTTELHITHADLEQAVPGWHDTPMLVISSELGDLDGQCKPLVVGIPMDKDMRKAVVALAFGTSVKLENIIPLYGPAPELDDVDTQAVKVKNSLTDTGLLLQELTPELPKLKVVPIQGGRDLKQRVGRLLDLLLAVLPGTGPPPGVPRLDPRDKNFSRVARPDTITAFVESSRSLIRHKLYTEGSGTAQEARAVAAVMDKTIASMVQHLRLKGKELSPRQDGLSPGKWVNIDQAMKRMTVAMLRKIEDITFSAVAVKNVTFSTSTTPQVDVSKLLHVASRQKFLCPAMLRDECTEEGCPKLHLGPNGQVPTQKEWKIILSSVVKALDKAGVLAPSRA